MRVGIMQPYFFPYLGYFALIERCDQWVVFDVTQYTPKTWMNRNRVLHPSAGTNWVTVPLANSSQSIAIREARVLDGTAALTTTLGKLSHYRRKAPHWRAVEDLVRSAFEAVTDDSLVSLNVSTMAAVCGYLDVAFQPTICSELDVDLGSVDHAGGWAPLVAEALGASEYLNPIGGQELFTEREFSERGIALEFLNFPVFEYDTSPYAFEPGLSVLDVLMWNAPDQVRAAISEATIKPAAELLTS
jgi:hypothetical protein